VTEWPLHLAEARQGSAGTGTAFAGNGSPVDGVPGSVTGTVQLGPPLAPTVAML
jgi:hypothetical protein